MSQVSALKRRLVQIMMMPIRMNRRTHLIRNEPISLMPSMMRNTGMKYAATPKYLLMNR